MPPAPNQRDSEISKLPTWVVDTMEDKLTINKAYAAKYQKRKQAEELSRRKCRNIAMNDPSLKCPHNHAAFHYVGCTEIAYTGGRADA